MELASSNSLKMAMERRERLGQELLRCIEELAAVSEKTDALRVDLATGLYRLRATGRRPRTRRSR